MLTDDARASRDLLEKDDLEELSELWSIAWTLQFLHDARAYLIRGNFDRNDIAAWELLYASSQRVMEEAFTWPDAECLAA